MKTKILIGIIVVACLIIVVGSILANKSNTTTKDISENSMPGYTQITAIPGASFYVNSTFVDKATAISQISENINFQKNQYYSYKNGVDQYILFNMEDLVVVAQRGTDFYINSSNEKEYALMNGNIMNIWFTQGSKKFDSETNGSKTITKANAGVKINSTTYGDFCGELANITKDNEEWSLFVGVPGERYDKISSNARDGIETIINTFDFSNYSDLVNQEIYAVSLSGETTEKEVVETSEEVIAVDESSINLTNTAIVEKDEEKAYTSTPYNMLSIGDNGLLNAFNDYTMSYEEPIICVKKVYRGKDAEKIIKDFCTSEKVYDYKDAPDGSAWEVVEYDLNYRGCENHDYVNIKLKGLDGDYLRYRGLKYTAKTYDINYKTYEDGDWIRGFYAFYAVPNGCVEYCIEAGEDASVIDTIEVHAAYYNVKQSAEPLETEQTPTTQMPAQMPAEK